MEERVAAQAVERAEAMVLARLEERAVVMVMMMMAAAANGEHSQCPVRWAHCPQLNRDNTVEEEGVGVAARAAV